MLHTKSITDAFDRMPCYTGILAQIADAIGGDGAEAIARKYGGTRLYVPVRMHAGHLLADLLGLDKAQALSAVFGGQEHFDIPQAAALKRAKRDAQICIDRSNGASVSELALKNEMSERNIRTILSIGRKHQQSHTSTNPSHPKESPIHNRERKSHGQTTSQKHNQSHQ